MRALMIVAVALGCWACVGAAQNPPSKDPPSNDPPTRDPPAKAPAKAPKPKSRLKLLQQMQVDFDMAASGAKDKTDNKGRKKLEKCHEVLIDAIAQQQRYKSVNVGKVNGCLNDIDKLDEAGIFNGADRGKLREDREKLRESVGKSRKYHLPAPL
jgi:hypothetical protein